MSLILLVLAGWSGYVLLMEMVEVQDVSLACITCLKSTSPTAKPKSQGWERGYTQLFQLQKLQSYIERGVANGRSRANHQSHMENNPVAFPYLTS